jgi:hypothetical protein
MRKISGIAVISGILAFPIAAPTQAQGIVNSAERGAGGHGSLATLGRNVGGALGHQIGAGGGIRRRSALS